MSCLASTFCWTRRSSLGSLRSTSHPGPPVSSPSLSTTPERERERKKNLFAKYITKEETNSKNVTPRQAYPGVDPGICIYGADPLPFPHLSFLPFFSPPLPLGSRVPLKPAWGLAERCYLSQWGPRRICGRKRIWCTLKR